MYSLAFQGNIFSIALEGNISSIAVEAKHFFTYRKCPIIEGNVSTFVWNFKPPVAKPATQLI
jgi:hypothetical protein